MYVGFEPIFDSESEILILGSFPSVKSREVNFYYGNKQNRFWKILKEIFGSDTLDTIKQKQEFLLKNKIALWDIVGECEIIGSLDSNLKCKKVNDLSIILNNANIKMILLNGKKAHEIFKKNYGDINIPYFCMPSTSPANTRFDKEEWHNKLKK